MKLYFKKDFKEIYPYLCEECRHIAKMCYYYLDEDSAIQNLCFYCFAKLSTQELIGAKLTFKEKLLEKKERIVDLAKEYWMITLLFSEGVIFLFLVIIGVL